MNTPQAFPPANGNPRSSVGPTALNSWKEIAQYVGRGVRTVQRWERELALPVRRPHDHLRSPVIAIPSEIDEWLRRGKPRRGGNRGTITTSEVLQQANSLNEKLKETCKQTQKLSETITQTIARTKFRNIPNHSNGRNGLRPE